MTVITLTMVSLVTRTTTATFRETVLRRIRQDGGSTGESTQIYELRYNFNYIKNK